MLEHHKKPVISKEAFIKRILRAIFLGTLATLFTLGIGMVGYHHFAGIAWVDAYLESAMIFAGMGPTVTMQTTDAKIFSGTYALFCAFALILPVTLVLLPILHRFLHKFHIDTEEK